MTVDIRPAGSGPEAGPLRLAAALAARLVRPIGHFKPSAHPLPLLDEAALHALAADPSFGPPVQRAASAAMAGPKTIDAALLVRLRESPAVRLAALLVIESELVLQEAARLLAGVILHRGILAAVLKADRERLRSAFGAAAFAVATQEAALLHAGLSDLIDGPAQSASLAHADGEAVRAAALRLGLGILQRFARTVEPDLGAWLALRFAPEPAAPLDAEACEHIVRLMRRRMDAWSPIIA